MWVSSNVPPCVNFKRWRSVVSLVQELFEEQFPSKLTREGDRKDPVFELYSQAVKDVFLIHIQPLYIHPRTFFL